MDLHTRQASLSEGGQAGEGRWMDLHTTLEKLL